MIDEHAARLKFWRGEKSREVRIYAPCPCGCSRHWYLSGSDAKGHGFSLILPGEVQARTLARMLGINVEH